MCNESLDPELAAPPSASLSDVHSDGEEFESRDASPICVCRAVTGRIVESAAGSYYAFHVDDVDNASNEVVSELLVQDI